MQARVCTARYTLFRGIGEVGIQAPTSVYLRHQYIVGAIARRAGKLPYTSTFFNPCRAPKFLPILTSSKNVPKKGFQL